MTCVNGHDVEKEIISNRRRCPVCYSEGQIRRTERRRKGEPRPDMVPYSLRCPECSLFPCRCEAL